MGAGGPVAYSGYMEARAVAYSGYMGARGPTAYSGYMGARGHGNMGEGVELLTVGTWG